MPRSRSRWSAGKTLQKLETKGHVLEREFLDETVRVRVRIG